MAGRADQGSIEFRRKASVLRRASSAALEACRRKLVAAHLGGDTVKFAVRWRATCDVEERNTSEHAVCCVSFLVSSLFCAELISCHTWVVIIATPRNSAHHIWRVFSGEDPCTPEMTAKACSHHESLSHSEACDRDSTTPEPKHRMLRAPGYKTSNAVDSWICRAVGGAPGVT